MGDRDQHHSQFRIISISQSTEYGTLYSLDELRSLADFAHTHKLLLHIDGARLANAAAALKCSLKAMTKDVGVDVVSFGGAKNGMLFGEAIISFCPELSSNIRFYRKQCTQLFSKMRYISAQYQAYLQDDLWLHNANHANHMATLLAAKLAQIPQVQITQEVMVNSLFVILPEQVIAPMQEQFLFYTWDEARHEVRLMCSFDTTEAHLDAFVETLQRVLV
jgi:threonine aldolase